MKKKKNIKQRTSVLKRLVFARGPNTQTPNYIVSVSAEVNFAM